ncbi:hypothetical protein H3H39_02440 [Duganella sp. LX47W]|uniref:Uncharacterized protein n=2 Tax=Rugamonas apoptosis TaxID=2758570 RepID=A0A7W2F6B6_9BURK|nr:hypothetical protein [Rugamonas apoptosis]
MYRNIMSTFISLVHATAPQFSLMAALEITAALGAALALLLLFKPLLLGVARALQLVIKPKLTKEQRLQRRLMRDAMLLNRMLNSMEGSPSHAAELRALAARG